jgi:hypothetical protein
MAHTYEELSKMTVTQLREIAHGIEHEAVKGASTMHKEKLLPALCVALGIEAHKHHEIVGLNKVQIKAEIRMMKAKKAEALASGDRKSFKQIIRKIHDLKKAIRKAMV